MCPSGETGAGLVPACWPDQKPVRLVGRDPSQSEASLAQPRVAYALAMLRVGGSSASGSADLTIFGRLSLGLARAREANPPLSKAAKRLRILVA
jgi:hypothetical protein